MSERDIWQAGYEAGLKEAAERAERMLRTEAGYHANNRGSRLDQYAPGCIGDLADKVKREGLKP